jgi:tryptophanyl-tRNA synthetase
MLITSARLERNPTVKDQVRDLNIENISYGHLGYPVLQAADILLYKGEVVPVGEDQVPHVEITREIARRFNAQYGKVFPEPEPKLTTFARLPGLDGSMKMSKSAGNTILLSDSPEEIAKRMKTAVTDPQKVRKGDPGRPEICLVFTYHKKFNPPSSRIETNCRGRPDASTANSTRPQSRRLSRPDPRTEKALRGPSGGSEGDPRCGRNDRPWNARTTIEEVHTAMNLGVI